MSHVMMCHCHAAEAQALVGEDEVVSCDDSEAMLGEVALHHPDVVVYELRPESKSDLAMLRLLRRIAPRMPLVVVGDEESLRWETPADLAPLYRAPLPVVEDALRGAVHSALEHH
ncbi:MAG: hypothetical protein HZC42_02990 [Candidatus Eisenbacteria bacterium]|nr:hypothetical protein [Candidatus Eisenbacteria bacterium]